MRILLLNGAPRSGKDTAGAILCDLLDDARRYAFANQVKEMAMGAMGVPMSWIKHFEAMKDEPSPILCGRSFRECCIQMSEGFAKPLFGDRYFGDALAADISAIAADQGDHIAIVTDSGFREEAEALVDTFGRSSVRRILISRPGTSFDHDSRSIWPPIEGVHDHYVRNDGTVDDLRKSLAELASDIWIWLESGRTLAQPDRAEC